MEWGTILANVRIRRLSIKYVQPQGIKYVQPQGRLNYFKAVRKDIVNECKLLYKNKYYLVIGKKSYKQ